MSLSVAQNRAHGRDRYSRAVRVLRIALPVFALVLTASIFVLSKTSALREGLILPDAQLMELAIGQKITNPHFSGVTQSGDAFSILAASALPDAPRPELIELEQPRTTLDFANGRQLESHAVAGRLDLQNSIARLSGGVSLSTSDGYAANSDVLVLNFATGNVISPGPVTAKGPIGEISAGRMHLRQNLHQNPDGGRAILRFNKGVKVVYTPQHP